MTDFIYLDNAATTRVAPEAAACMQTCFLEHYGNPSSSHVFGLRAAEAVAQARKTMARLLSASPEEILFTAGGSEADNLALLGTARATRRRKLVVSAIEHPAVLETATALQEQGFKVAVAPVDSTGLVVEESLAELVDDDTFLVSIMAGNNEIGTVQPIRRLARLVKKMAPHVLFHTDAVQYFGKAPIELAGGPIDLLSLAGHKIHGPKGIGALYVRKGIRLQPLIYGGGQEAGIRAGTENVPAIAGLACAAGLMVERLAEHTALMAAVTGRICERLREAFPDLIVNGHPEFRLPNVLSISVPGLKSQNLLHFLEEQGVIVSAGSACHSHGSKGSHVLEAIGRKEDFATIRVSASIYNTVDEAEIAAEKICAVIKRLRG
jgi:cysteine desulfurase